jgi:hypothetical protein
MDLGWVGWGDVDWIGLAEDRTTYLCLVSRLRIKGAIVSLFHKSSCCGVYIIEHRDSFSFTLIYTEGPERSCKVDGMIGTAEPENVRLLPAVADFSIFPPCDVYHPA